MKIPKKIHFLNLSKLVTSSGYLNFNFDYSIAFFQFNSLPACFFSPHPFGHPLHCHLAADYFRCEFSGQRGFDLILNLRDQVPHLLVAVIPESLLAIAVQKDGH